MRGEKAQERGLRERGGGNVFADLGLPDPGEHQLKAWIVTHIGRRIREEELTQPDLSAVLHGRFRGYSAERLARALAALGARCG